ncbi:LOW QUALITY PROTEIN: sodium/nucleoside cotransporter 2 [Lycaon pictus]
MHMSFDRMYGDFISLWVTWFLTTTGTTATNTLAVARSIFVGLTEAPLLIHLYLADIMPSEIHAVMTGAFATILVIVLGAPSSLICASVVAAPSALALSKLVDQREAKFKNKGVKLPCGEEKNVLEAASNGARDAIGHIDNLAAILISFLTVVSFISAALSWLRELVDRESLVPGLLSLGYLSFTQVICSYILRPSFMMGVEAEPVVGVMVGIKFFTNECVAQQLSQYKNRHLFGM